MMCVCSVQLCVSDPLGVDGSSPGTFDGGDGNPGKPWEHYILKDATHGYKCSRCLLTGHVSDIRDKPCKVPAPTSSEASLPPPASNETVPAGASAAAVGSEVLAAAQPVAAHASDAVDSMRPVHHDAPADLLEEIQQLEALEQKLQQCVREQDARELAEELELAELEQEILEMESLMTEEDYLEKALKESMDEYIAREAEEAREAGGTREAEEPLKPRELFVGPTNIFNSPVATSTSDGAAASDVVDPDTKKHYQKYWSRFVATPQRSNSITAKTAPLPPSASNFFLNSAKFLCFAPKLA